MLEIKTTYTPEESWMDNGRGTLKLGDQPGEFYPYDLLLGSLSSCFYSNLAGIFEKQKLSPAKVEIVITGEKREEIPSLLTWVHLEIRITGSVDHKKALKAVDLAAKYCSIHETLSRVATMTHKVSFIE